MSIPPAASRARLPGHVGGQFLDGVSNAHSSPAPASRPTLVEDAKTAAPRRGQRSCGRSCRNLQREDGTAATHESKCEEIQQKLAANSIASRKTNPAIAAIGRTCPSASHRRRRRGAGPARIAAWKRRGGCRIRWCFASANCRNSPRRQPKSTATSRISRQASRPPPRCRRRTLPKRRRADHLAGRSASTARSCPAASDRYRFQARKGQQLVVAVSARELIPYLADAVPGWFQATLALYDAQGKELAYDDHYRFHPDPVLFYEIPADGQYTLEIHDALYRGREDFVYRIAMGELPFVTSIFPLGGRPARKPRSSCGLESAVNQRDDGAKGKPRGSIRFRVHQGRMAFQPRAVRRGHAAGMPGTRTQRLAANRPAGHAAGDRQRAHRSAGRLGRVPLRRPRRASRLSPKSMRAGWIRRWIRCSS